MTTKQPTLYKLTDQDGYTYNKTKWGENVTHEATGEIDQPLCSDGWIHAYEHPLIAAFLNPIHANFSHSRLWEATGEIGKRDGQIKCGCRKLTTIREIPLPAVTTEMRIRFALLCSLETPTSPEYRQWAHDWLSNKDRSANSARDAARAADAAAASAAARAAYADADAASAAAASSAAAYAADAAYASSFNQKINLISLAEKACAHSEG